MNSALSSMKRMMDDLRRRKVFRAAAAYTVTAWLVIAIADVVVPVLRLPDWTMNLVILLAIAGLPIAVVLSWLFDFSPDGGVVRTTTQMPSAAASAGPGSFVIAALTGALVVVAGFWLWRPFSPVAASDIRSIAVLPFVDFSEQHDTGYLGDGLAEELLNALVGLDGLRVAARTSSFAFKGLNEDVRSIGQKLNVDTVLEGSVRRSGDRVRVTAQLINVSDGFHLWSQTYDRQLNDIFAIQDEIALAIVDALRVKLGAGEDRRVARASSTSFAAYDLYLLGRHHWHQRTPASLQRAVDLFEEAAGQDPEFALAYSGLADAYLLLRDYGDLDNSVAQARAEAAIARALQLDNELAEPYASLGLLRMSRDELTGAELAFRNAIELDSSYSMAHMWLGLVLDRTQGPLAAVTEYRAAYRSDPLHPVINGNLAGALARMGEYEQARRYLQQSEAANPDSASLRVHLSWLESYYGRLDEAVRWALGVNRSQQELAEKTQPLLATSFATMGDLNQAMTYLGAQDPATESARAFGARAQVLFAGGEYARLLTLASSRIEQKPADDEIAVTERIWSGIARMAQSDYAGAIVDFEAVLDFAAKKGLDAPVHIDTLGMLAFSYGKLGNTVERDSHLALSQEVLERERQRGWNSPAFRVAAAGTFALQGDSRRALAELAAAIDSGFRDYHWLSFDPRFENLRDESQFQQSIAGVRSELDRMLGRSTELIKATVAASLR
ncbi:MAG: hypothetical protein KJO54_02475 [Gammaproteobacteria bacterium]|nr:hypothetical protein [Gammaproteobacteria bacterium]NNF61961.1 hypothetical protein [Gammaproteobacteria bacterium]NNM21861.1 hypothetical protein [Gammaproteobacteria bacterium]